MSPRRTQSGNIRKRVPIRTCVSCRRKASKRELLRVVASAGGAVAVDERGKRNGRGAYLCATCRAKPADLRRGRLEYALRTKIPENEWTVLLSEVDRV